MSLTKKIFISSERFEEFQFFSIAIRLRHGQLWAIPKETASLMLITAFQLFRSQGHREPHSEIGP